MPRIGMPHAHKHQTSADLGGQAIS